MSSRLYDVEYLFKVGLGIRPVWKTWAARLPLESAEKLCAVQRLTSAGDWAKAWRVVPCRKPHSRLRPLDSFEKGVSRAIRAMGETRRNWTPPDMERDRHGRLVVRLGGAR
jgi:hypothetical protein